MPHVYFRTTQWDTEVIVKAEVTLAAQVVTALDGNQLCQPLNYYVMDGR